MKTSTKNNSGYKNTRKKCSRENIDFKWKGSGYGRNNKLLLLLKNKNSEWKLRAKINNCKKC